MESAAFGLQTAYGVHLPVTVGASAGLEKPEDAPLRNPAAGGASQTPSSTRVTLSAAGQSRLAAEQQASIQSAETAARESAAVPQNVPVQANQEAIAARNTPNNTTAGIALTQNNPAPSQSLARDPSSTGAATPRPTAFTSAAFEPAPFGAPPGVAGESASRINSPAAAPSALDNSPVPARQEAEQQVQQRERQDTAAQSRQDDSPALAQSGITDNREVLSP